MVLPEKGRRIDSENLVEFAVDLEVRLLLHQALVDSEEGPRMDFLVVSVVGGAADCWS